jgi:hypothetical protein
MFIELPDLESSSLQRSEMYGPTNCHLPLHCAPLERQSTVGREVYKHSAPPEPEDRRLRPRFPVPT